MGFNVRNWALSILYMFMLSKYMILWAFMIFLLLLRSAKKLYMINIIHEWNVPSYHQMQRKQLNLHRVTNVLTSYHARTIREAWTMKKSVLLAVLFFSVILVTETSSFRTRWDSFIESTTDEVIFLNWYKSYINLILGWKWFLFVFYWVL